MEIYPRVAVVILNWNGREFLKQFLPAVVASSYPNLEVIVADNKSDDDSVEIISTYFSTVRLILNSKNFGFAGGYNEALKHVDADYFVLLNSDVEVTPGWIEPVVTLMESDPEIAVAQPKIKAWNNKNAFEYAGAAGGFIDKYGYPFCRGRLFDAVETDEGQYNEASEIFWASGAALFIKRTCWEKVGGFDADFFAHMEEIDLCWGLKNMGYKIMYCPDSTVYHIGGGTLDNTSPYKSYLNFRNNLAMLLKNLPASKRFFILFTRFWLDFITLLKFLAGGQFYQARAINKAHIAFFKDFRRNLDKGKKSSGEFQHSGLYQKSIVWMYFAKRIRKFSQLKMD